VRVTNLQVGRLVTAALADVEAALTLVAAARAEPWRSPAADHYRDALDELSGRLRACRDAVQTAVGPAAALDAATPLGAPGPL
jgi:hypothetical protein